MRNILGISIIILAAVISRLLPHPPNFTPIGAIALLGAVYYSSRWMAFVIPLVIMFISDLLIGLHSTILFVYGSFGVITLLGFWLRKHFSWKNLILVSLLSSILFFLITNFGVWLMYEVYPKNFAGLIESYVAGIPFFRNNVLGDLFYNFLLFGSVEILKRYNIITVPQNG